MPNSGKENVTANVLHCDGMAWHGYDTAYLLDLRHSHHHSPGGTLIAFSFNIDQFFHKHEFENGHNKRSNVLTVAIRLCKEVNVVAMVGSRYCILQR